MEPPRRPSAKLIALLLAGALLACAWNAEASRSGTAVTTHAGQRFVPGARGDAKARRRRQAWVSALKLTPARHCKRCSPPPPAPPPPPPPQPPPPAGSLPAIGAQFHCT